MSKINPTIFREYDIRGVVDKDLTEDGVAAIGRAYATFAKKAGAQRVSVGRDCREHSTRLAKQLFRGLTEGGLDVVDLGTVTTPMQYYSIRKDGLDGGIQITGSHNPPEYNGLKLSLGKRSIHGPEVQELLRIIQEDDYGKADRVGSIEGRDVFPDYLAYCKENLQMGERKLKVVLDGGNGTGGPFAVPVFEALGVEVVQLYCDMDDTFPNHHPDPTVEKNLEDLKAKVLEHKADLGIAFDGDADRLGAVDEKGQVMWGDQLMILFARSVLADVPGATIIGEVKCSRTLYADIEAHGGVAVMGKTGHSLIKDKMRETGAALAGEMSGHIFFAHRFFGFDDGIYAGARLVELLSHAEGPISGMLADVPKTFTTPEIRRDCPESLKFRLVDSMVTHFKERGDKVIDVDGARVEFDDGWGLIRASNTQPILVLRFEADTEARLSEIQAVIEGALAEVRRGLEAGE